MITALIVVASILVFIVIWFLIERQIITVRRQKVFLKALPDSFDGMSILQISDLHHRNFGENQCRIVEKTQKMRPDMIVITGDLVSRDERDFTVAGNFCKALCAVAPVYFSFGNHELDLPDKVRRTYIETLKAAGVKILFDEVCKVVRNDETLFIAGAGLDISVYHDGDFRYNNLNKYSGSELKNRIGVRQGCTLLLAHNPLIFEAYAQWKADLVLAGHVHGGVVRLPFIGGILSPERRFFPRYTKGLYMMDSSCMYVSAGLGKLRLLNPPEINLITLHRKSE